MKKLTKTDTRIILILVIVTVSLALLALPLYSPIANVPFWSPSSSTIASSERGVFYVKDAGSYLGKNPLTMNVDTISMKDGEVITLGNVTFKFREPPSTTTTVVNLTTTTVTSTAQIYYICPEWFEVTFRDGSTIMLEACTTVGQIGPLPRPAHWQMYQLTNHENPRAGLLVKGNETRLVELGVTLVVSNP